MSRFVQRAIASVIFLAALSPRSDADIIERDDGHQIEGLILSESSLEVVIRLETGAVVRFPRRHIRSISRADWQYYIQKGDSTSDGTEAIDFYLRAKELNPNTPDIDAKIEVAKRRAAEQARKREREREQVRREAEEGKIVAHYEWLMEAVRPEAAREFLEKEVAEKPWLCRSRILLADFHARDRTPEGRVRYATTLAGLVHNDPESYYAVYAPRLVETSERLLLDPVANAAMPLALKDRLATLVAPFVGEDGQLVAADQYESREIEMASSVPATLAKIEFFKNICVKRSVNQPSAEPELTILLTYAKALNTPEGRAALRPQFDRWTKRAHALVESGESAKGAAIAEIILVFNPKSTAARKVAVASRVEEARRLRKMALFDQARKSLETAEQILPKAEQVASEKARLFLAIAARHLKAGGIEAALENVHSASRVGAKDPEVAAAVKAGQKRLFQVLMANASNQASQDNLVAAVASVEMAMRANPLDAAGRTQARRVLSNYRKGLRDSLLNRMFAANNKTDYGDVAEAKRLAQQYGVWDETLQKTVAAIIKDAKDGGNQFIDNDDMGVAFMIFGRLVKLDPSAETMKKYRGARKIVVAGGQLGHNFFSGTWTGQNVAWILTDNAIAFDGGGLQVRATDLRANTIRVQHRGGAEYTVTVDRTSAEDEIAVQVMGPDTLLLESYLTRLAEDRQNPRAVNYNTQIKRAIGAAPPAIAPAPVRYDDDS